MKIQTIIVIILSGMLSITGFGCKQAGPEKHDGGLIPVTLESVVEQEVAEPIHTYGRLRAEEEIKLSFKIGGIIQSLYFDEGQKVRKGQHLAKLNLDEIEAKVKQARSGFEKVKRDMERVKNLYEEKAATLEQYQDIQTAFQVAESQLDAAEFNLRFSVIKAPSNGMILKRFGEENELIAAGVPVFLFGSTEGDWIVQAGVSDKDLVRLRTGDPAEIRFDAYPGSSFGAQVEKIVQSADPMTGTFEIELRVNAGSKKLVSGFVAEVNLFPTGTSLHFIVPISALVEADGVQGSVYTIDEKNMQAVRIPVTIGFVFDQKVAVSAGLEGVSQVVTDGAPYLTEGSKVRIVQK